MTVKKLNEREKRILLIGAVVAVAIVVFTFGGRGMERWSRSRADLAAAKKKLADVETDKSKQAGLAALVPVFEMPQTEDKQKFLFREKLLEQMKKSGINPAPLQSLPGKKINIGGVGYKVLKMKCKGKCKFDQLLDFLAAIRENPYFVGVEELRVQCDTKEPPEKRKDKEVEIDLVVSTFVRDVAAKPVEAEPVERPNQNSR